MELKLVLHFEMAYYGLCLERHGWKANSPMKRKKRRGQRRTRASHQGARDQERTTILRPGSPFRNQYAAQFLLWLKANLSSEKAYYLEGRPRLSSLLWMKIGLNLNIFSPRNEMEMKLPRTARRKEFAAPKTKVQISFISERRARLKGSKKLDVEGDKIKGAKVLDW